jgi:hypothetical protein
LRCSMPYLTFLERLLAQHLARWRAPHPLQRLMRALGLMNPLCAKVASSFLKAPPYPQASYHAVNYVWVVMAPSTRLKATQ